MIEFIGGTAGLNCSVNGRATLTRVEYSRAGKKIALQAVSGHSLAALHGVSVAKISQEEFGDRPRDPYNDLVEARWAFNKLGLTIGTEE